MLFSKNKNTNEYIINLLSDAPMTGPMIVQALKKERSISKETTYRLLRGLISDEVLQKIRGLYSLNRHWLQYMQTFARSNLSNIPMFDVHNVLDFEDEDTVTYSFKNSDLMGTYWGHLGDLVMQAHDADISFYIFHPHEWLIHARIASETFFLKQFEDNHRIIFFNIGGNEILDKKFKKDWKSKYRKINTGVSIGTKKNRYINVIGDFIFEVTTSAGFEDLIGGFFKKHTEVTDTNREELNEIINMKYKTKLNFSRNKKKAEQWRKRLGRNF